MIQVGAFKDSMAAQFEAAGMASRGFKAAYRVNGGEWKICTVDHGRGGRHPIWFETAEAAMLGAKAWVAKQAKRRARK